MEAISLACRENGEVWKRLVEADVAEALCQCVLEMITSIHTLPEMPRSARLQVQDTVSISLSPFIILLLVNSTLDPIALFFATGSDVHRISDL